MALLFGLPFPGTAVFQLPCLATAFAIVVISWRRLAPPPFPCKWPIALWAGVVLASLYWAVDPGHSLREIRSDVGYTLMAFVTFFVWTRDAKRLRLSCLAVLAGFLVISGSALGGYLLYGDWPADAYYGGVGSVSNYLVTVGPLLALTVRLLGHRHLIRRYALLCLAFLAVALLSAQRAVWPAIGFQAALLCFWLWHVNAVSIGRLRLALTGVILLALIGGGVYLSERYRTGGDSESLSAMAKDLRPRVWTRISAEILSHPWTGAGFGHDVMRKAYPALLPAGDKTFWHPHDGAVESNVFWQAHNLVLNYGVSAGVPGVVSVLLLFAALAWRFWHLTLRGQFLARLSALTGVAIVAGVFARNMANDFFVRDGALLFWTLVGMLLGYTLRDRWPADEHQDLRRAATHCGRRD
jgi:O-antigen ligase